MNLRTIIGGLSLFLFCKQFFAVAKMPFDYHYHLDNENIVDFKKGTYILSVKYFQHVLNKYPTPRIGDLVIYEKPDRTLAFRIVQGEPKTYYYDPSIISEFYVPAGHVVLLDPTNNQTKMECIGNVRGSRHYVLF